MSDSAPLPDRVETLVVGAGLSGLSCARLLERRGVDVHVVDASDDVGGRVRTDELDGFRLDRGFQVLLTAYEEVQGQVDLPRLDPRPFRPGSLVWNGESLQKLADPFRQPSDALASVSARVGSLGDKVRVASLRRGLLSNPSADCWTGPERSTLEELRAVGFSEDFIDRFFRPFLGGVFLERALETSASLFRYYFRCFAAGDAVVPAGGMQRLPELLAAPLEERVTLGAPVDAVRPDGVTLADGRTVAADTVVVAVDGTAASHLLGAPEPAFKGTVTAYFGASRPPTDEPMLILDGEGAGPANHVAVMSAVSPGYAPEGMHLVSVSGVDAAADDPDAFAEGAVEQLRGWFGSTVDGWRHLRTYHIPHALPRHPAGSLAAPESPARRDDGLVVCGDYTRFGSIQGALLSGRHAAETVLAERAGPGGAA